MKVNAIVLAGARNLGRLQECSQREYEALIEVNGTPMVGYVLNAALEATTVEEIVLVGPTEALQVLFSDQRVRFVKDQGQIVENLQIGLSAFEEERKVLVLTSDIPLLRPDTIDEFVENCGKNNFDFYYPIISEEVNVKHFPGTKRTYARLKEGTYTGGNIFLFQPEVIRQAADFMRKMVSLRKKPVKLGQFLGFKFVFKLLLGWLTIPELERRVTQLTGFSTRAMVFERPEIGFDVDKPSDLELITKFMEEAN